MKFQVHNIQCTHLLFTLYLMMFFSKDTQKAFIIISDCELNWKLNSISFSCHYGNTGCQVFKQGVQKWKDFCLKINIPKGSYWILRIGVMGKCQKVPKFDFQSQFSMSKIIQIFVNFIFVEEYKFRSTIFVIAIFW